MVLTTSEGSKFIHGFLNNAWNCIVIFIDSFTAGKVDIGILGRPAHHRTVWRQATLTVGNDEILIDHFTHIIFGQLLDFLDLMGGSEPVKEVYERNSGFQGRLG